MIVDTTDEEKKENNMELLSAGYYKRDRLANMVR